MLPRLQSGFRAMSGLLALSVACAVGCNGCSSSNNSSTGTTARRVPPGVRQERQGPPEARGRLAPLVRPVPPEVRRLR